jgi:hypothetical protein
MPVLRGAIPGAREVAGLEGAKLFFPWERPVELATAMRNFWRQKPTSGPLFAQGTVPAFAQGTVPADWSRALPSKASQPLKHRFKGCALKEIYNGETADAILPVADGRLGVML